MERLPGSVELEMIAIPAGSFMMGSPDSDGKAFSSERPQHQVNVKAFAIGKYPVTQAQYEAVMGSNPSHFQGNPNRPVENIGWHDAVEFCGQLSTLTGKQYRLPSEAEWEYACRAGTTTPYYFGNDTSQFGDYAWFNKNAGVKLLMFGGSSQPVGRKKPNQWGLYDMHGNVWEWCKDKWHDNYAGAPNDGSAWLEGSSSRRRVVRGGSWVNYPGFCRSACRFNFNPDLRYNLIVGLRVVCERLNLS